MLIHSKIREEAQDGLFRKNDNYCPPKHFKSLEIFLNIWENLVFFLI